MFCTPVLRGFRHFCGFRAFSLSSNEPPCLWLSQGGKRNPNPNFLVRIFSSGVGVFHVKGWGPKSSIRPSKPGKSNFLGGISRDFAGISRGCPKSLRKKVCVQSPFPNSLSCVDVLVVPVVFVETTGLQNIGLAEPSCRNIQIRHGRTRKLS